MDLPDPGIKHGSPVLQADSLPTELSGKSIYTIPCVKQRARGKQLDSTGSLAQCSVMTGGGGSEMGVRGREMQVRGDTCILTADSCCCIAETNTTL